MLPPLRYDVIESLKKPYNLKTQVLPDYDIDITEPNGRYKASLDYLQLGELRLPPLNKQGYFNKQCQTRSVPANSQLKL
jgi:hypothetical protein